MDMLDVVGTPEYFVTKIGKVESAGGGCIRIYLCAERGGFLMPMYTSVMPALDMAACARDVQEGVRLIYAAERMMRVDH